MRSSILRAISPRSCKARVAPGDRPLGRAGVPVLANGLEMAIGLDEASVAGRILGVEPERDDGRTSARGAQPLEGFGAHERRVAESDHDVVDRVFERRPCARERMRGRALGLHVDFRARNECRRLARDTLPLGTDHDRRARLPPGIRPRARARSSSARDLVQHLGTRRLHARPSPAAKTTARQRRVEDASARKT